MSAGADDFVLQLMIGEGTPLESSYPSPAAGMCGSTRW